MFEILPNLIAAAWIAAPHGAGFFPERMLALLAQPASANKAPCRDPGSWIEENFAQVNTLSGAFDGRVAVKSPVWVRDATISNARYGIAIRAGTDTEDHRAAVTKVSISGLRSKTSHGAGIRTYRRGAGIELFLEDVTIKPKWPDWRSYDDTNYDGIVLDGAAAFFARNLTISDWNADAAIDNKAQVSQIVGLRVSGPGHRPLRYWRDGPHYLVDARIDRPDEGTLIWIKDCNRMSLRVYGSRFNGAERLSEKMIECAEGAAADIVYLSDDPRFSGELHPMLSECPDTEGRRVGGD